MRESPDADEALLLSGEPEGFGRFYDRYVQSLLAYFQRRTRDPEAAADLTAETFAAALHAPSPLQRTGDAGVGAAVRGRAPQADRLSPLRLGGEPDAQAARDRAPAAGDGGHGNDPHAGDDVALQLISELPREQRDAIREHVFEDRDHGDIARDQMASEATVRKRVSRGLSALRARVGGVR